MPKVTQQRFDLYTFVAGTALETGKPFPLTCNCGAVVTIMPPFQDVTVHGAVVMRDGGVSPRSAA